MRKNILLLVIVALILATGCTPLRKIKLLQDIEEQNQTEIKHNKPFVYKINTNDILYVKITGIDDKSSGFLNGDNISIASNVTKISLYLNSYKVNDSGYVHLPVIGNVHLKDLTIDAARDTVQKLALTYINQTTVIVKLVNFNVSILGEVVNPGFFTVYENQINVFEALSLAGDFTAYANRKNVTLVRTLDGKSSEIHHLDLTDRNIIASEFYFLMPNDILYIEPNKAKPFGTNPLPIPTILSILTTFVLLFKFIYPN